MDLIVRSNVRADVQVRDVRGEETKKFKHLGSTLTESRECEVELEERINAE